MRSGFVSIVGRPNVGKSTLLNTILDRKIAIVSDKAQTTRNNIMGIYHEDDAEIIFIDTPGIHKPKHNLGKALNSKAYYSINDVDIILLVVDISLNLGPGDKFVIDKLKDINKPVILVLNKIDKIRKETILNKINEYKDLYDSCEIVPVSVIDKKDVKISSADYSGEKILNYTSDEVPHAITCVTENIKYGKDSVEVDVLIIVERDNLKKIIVGHNGEMIKKIGIESRKDIESLLGKKVYLNLFVKTINKWRDKEKYLLEFGYKNNE